MPPLTPPPLTLPPALLLGGGGRLPFRGHIRRGLRSGDAHLHLAARVAHTADPGAAWQAAGALWEALDGCAGRDRYTLCRAAWERLVGLNREALGPHRGEDLTLLMVCADPQGQILSGCGLGALWAVDAQGLRELVEPGHPLLGAAGLPKTLPRVLGPSLPASAYVARPGGEEGPAPDPERLAALCGVRA